MRHARLELAPGSLRLLAMDARKGPLVATVNDALRVVALSIPEGLTTTTPELRRWWVGGRVCWICRVTIEQPDATDMLASELRSRGFSVAVEQAKRGIVGA